MLICKAGFCQQLHELPLGELTRHRKNVYGFPRSLHARTVRMAGRTYLVLGSTLVSTPCQVLHWDLMRRKIRDALNSELRENSRLLMRMNARRSFLKELFGSHCSNGLNFNVTCDSQHENGRGTRVFATAFV